MEHERPDLRGVPIYSRNHTRGVKISQDDSQNNLYAAVSVLVFVMAIVGIVLMHLAGNKRQGVGKQAYKAYQKHR